MSVDRCANPATPRRRIFWTTQPTACGEYDDCSSTCGIPGLQYAGNPAADDFITGRTFVTDEWLRSLVINILMTDGRKADTPCGYRPGAQGGHWSESYRTDGQPIGSLIRTVGAMGRIRDAVNQVKAYAQVALAQLVGLGVATSVEVEASYISGGRMSINVIVYGPAGDTARVGLSGSRLSNGWVWQ